MMVVALIVAGVVALAWPSLAPLVDRVRAAVPSMTPRHYAGLALLAAALVYGLAPDGKPTPGPEPAPDAGPLTLRGMFTGPTASDDASLLGALCLELADEIQFSANDPTGYLSTGVAVDELRRSARVLRCRGISIGDRQPAARDAIAKYLEAAVGTDGGPLTPEQRSAWVAAYRDIGRAASDAAR